MRQITLTVGLDGSITPSSTYAGTTADNLATEIILSGGPEDAERTEIVYGVVIKDAQGNVGYYSEELVEGSVSIPGFIMDACRGGTLPINLEWTYSDGRIVSSSQTILTVDVLPRADGTMLADFGDTLMLRTSPWTWMAGKEYRTDSIVISDGRIWTSLQDGNRGHDPAEGDWWHEVKGSKGDTGPAGPTGPQGIQGPTGRPFSIFKTYASVAAMQADLANVPEGMFVAIASRVSDPDNAKLYLRGPSAWTFITDMSGAQGIEGPPGQQGIQGPPGPAGEAGQPGPAGEAGPAGPPGQTGSRGYGVTASKTGDYGLTIHHEDPEEYDVVYDSLRGEQGIQGEPGPQGLPGSTGPRGYSIEATKTGEYGLTITSTDPSVTPVVYSSLRGEQGEPGPEGPVGPPGPAANIDQTWVEGSINGVASGLIQTALAGKQPIGSYLTPSDVSAVATSGSYNDLTNKPTIPSAISELSEDSTHRTVSDADKATWNGKLDKSSTGGIVYGTDAQGNQQTISYSDSATANTVAKRTTSGRLSVGTPTANGDATTKQYVDTEVSGAKTYADTAVAGVTAASLGLGNVDNTSDTDKPISTATQGAINTLQDQIDAIESKSDVTDVVADIDALNDYDTSTLFDSDIIRVLVDSTEGGASSYYRYVQASDDFVLVGSLGPYYTKSEMDTALAGKQASLSTAQTNAVNSGITSGKVTTYDGYAATIASKANDADLSAVAKSGSYNDLNDTPTIPSTLAGLAEDATHRVVTDTEKSAWNGKQSALDATQMNAVNSGITSGKVTTYDGYATTIASKANSADLSTVALTGSYNDLSNKPTIPDELADLASDATHRTVTDTEKSTWNGKQPAGDYATNTTVNGKEAKGKITINGTEYTVRVSTTDSGASGYITFVTE